ncbi:hypothetical protein [Anaeromicropila populeti]|uniref:hypothetical protein n=1 Tax=Anaeromicropila populeti TaxID=37658 RepID=UPI001A9A4505|nr:hypothetical protein [Anaeromicropila populeti]
MGGKFQYNYFAKGYTFLRNYGTPLQRLRAEQMLSIVMEGKLENYVSELAQLIVTEVTV